MIGIIPGVLIGVVAVVVGGDPFYDESYDDRAGLGSIILVLLAAVVGFVLATMLAGILIGSRLPLSWPRRLFFILGGLSFFTCVIASLAALEAVLSIIEPVPVERWFDEAL